MAFRFNWPEFSSELLADARRLLNGALNKGSKPTNIVSDIVVKELNMGSVPPELEILEISELTEEKFRGIFKFTYLGDAFVVLETKVQANPVTPRRTGISILGNPRQDVLAAEPLVLPMRLRISSLCLKGIVVLVIDQHRGVTLAFKNDPVERVDVSSTFDGMPNVQRFLQAEIEKQLRSLFQDDLPAMVHTLSLRYLQEAWQRRGAEALRGKESDATYEESIANLSDRSESVNCGSAFDYEQPGASSAADQLCGGWETFGDEFKGANEMEPVTDYARLSSLYKGEGLKSLAQETCSVISDTSTLRDDTGPSFPRNRLNASYVSRSDISTSSTLRGLVVHSSGLLANARFAYGLGTVPATGTDSGAARRRGQCPEIRPSPRPDLRQCPSTGACSHGYSPVIGCVWNTCRTSMESFPTPVTWSPRPTSSPADADFFDSSSALKVSTKVAVSSAASEGGLSATVPPASPRPDLRKFYAYQGKASEPNESFPTTASESSKAAGDLEEDTWHGSFPSEIILHPSQNAAAAQLLSLMKTNRTFSPHTLSGTIRHLTFRSTPSSFLAAPFPCCFAQSSPSTCTANMRISPNTRLSSASFPRASAAKPVTRTTSPNTESYVSAARGSSTTTGCCLPGSTPNLKARRRPHDHPPYSDRPHRHPYQEYAAAFSPTPSRRTSPGKRSRVGSHVVTLSAPPYLADGAR